MTQFKKVASRALVTTSHAKFIPFYTEERIAELTHEVKIDLVQASKEILLVSDQEDFESYCNSVNVWRAE